MTQRSTTATGRWTLVRERSTRPTRRTLMSAAGGGIRWLLLLLLLTLTPTPTPPLVFGGEVSSSARQGSAPAGHGGVLLLLLALVGRRTVSQRPPASPQTRTARPGPWSAGPGETYIRRSARARGWALAAAGAGAASCRGGRVEERWRACRAALAGVRQWAADGGAGGKEGRDGSGGRMPSAWFGSAMMPVRGSPSSRWHRQSSFVSVCVAASELGLRCVPSLCRCPPPTSPRRTGPGYLCKVIHM